MANEPINELRRDLEQEAELTRERLLDTIGQLEQRGQEALDWRLQVRRHSGALAALGSACAATVAVPVIVSVYRASTRSQRLREERARALKRFWKHPELVAVKRRRGAGWLSQALLLGAGALLVGAAVKYSLAAQKRTLLLAPPVKPFAV